MLAAATVLATALLPGAQASPEPTKLNIENLIPESPRLDYQREVLEPLHQAQKAEAEERLAHQRELERVRVVQVAQVSGDCYEAMRTTWPQELWTGATIVMQRESGARSYAIGTINDNGSQDFGCFQINNFAHQEFFQSHDWSNAHQNAAYAYQLYTGRGNWTAWNAVRGILW